MKRLLAWLGGHELAVLLGGIGVVAGIWIFVAIAGEVMEGDTLAFDRKILLSMRHPGDLSPIGPASLQESARDVTALGGVAVLGLLTVSIGAFLALDGKGRMAGFICASILGGLAVSTVLKDLFQRPRPDLVPHGSYVFTSSFPSGHSMMSAVTYLTLGALLARAHERKRMKAFFLILAALLTFCVGVSRVYLGVHWPTDVLAGWTAGTVWALICWLTARWLQGRKALEPEAELSLTSRPL
jgi:undecaprenyl-diphosphatase